MRGYTLRLGGIPSSVGGILSQGVMFALCLDNVRENIKRFMALRGYTFKLGLGIRFEGVNLSEFIQLLGHTIINESGTFTDYTPVL